MTAGEPLPSNRPRIVEVAFWFWLLSSVLLIAFGMLLVFSEGDVPAVLRGAGAIFAVAGLVLGYLSGRARQRDAAFRRAAVALALALVVLIALFTLMSGGLLWLIPMIAAMVGSVLMMRPSSQVWYDTGATQ